jgi:hypothetical protein
MGSGPPFEINVSLPHDARFAETARELAIHAARQAGHGEDEARAFGLDVERVVRRHIDSADSGNPIPLVVRRADGPVEVLVNGRTLTPSA